MKRVTVGILAHVDAGKTTLSEALLYSSGKIRRLGRVDKGDSYLDNFLMERERGITIFSKQANIVENGTEIILLDTPGHVDFSSETERTLRVLDYAILVVSGTDGTQAHTRTLWNLLARYRIPVFVFVNKTDMPTFDRAAVTENIKSKLSGAIIEYDAPHDEKFCEELAMCDEDFLDIFMSGDPDEETVKRECIRMTAERKIFPCFFGSALRLDGIDRLLFALSELTAEKKYPASFGAKVYKITRDESGARLTHVKITGGEVRAKMQIATRSQDDAEPEKIDGIRIYSGAKFTVAEKAEAGEVCALLGLENTYPGQGLGIEFESEKAVIEPVLRYRMKVPKECVMTEVYARVKKLEEEDPQLHAEYDERHGEIYVSIMGEVQLEVLRRVMRDRFATDVDFDAGNIVYRETIASPVVGSGHFEPLRHYAEVHLLLEPLPAGSGLVFDTLCSENLLDGRCQRLILSHLAEKKHIGVLTGSPITDMKISLIAGRENKKHTVGGDFRQATYRALRQGLMKAENVLLEPYYRFALEVPQENVGRVMTDISGMGGSFEPPVSIDDETTAVTGYAPVSAMRGYMQTVSAFTKGRGRLSLDFGGYRRCHDPAPVIEKIGYDPEADVYNTPDSVFCSGGSGVIVKWNEADAHMHLSDIVKENGEVKDESELEAEIMGGHAKKALSYEENRIMDDELVRIFESTYGKIAPRKLPPEKVKRVYDAESEKRAKKAKTNALLPEFLLVDGYNIIFAWDELKKIAEDNLGLARKLLTDLLSNYQGFVGHGVILVFDAYKVAGGKGSVEKVGGLYVVYTKEAETADAYIERVTFEMASKYRVRVATSDNLEQIIVLGHGATRISARTFHDEVSDVMKRLDEEVKKYTAR